MENQVFKGASPAVIKASKKEAGLKPLDIAMPNRPIKSPSPFPAATRHAEEGVINEFVEQVEKAGLKPEEVSGTLYIHQSNPRGVCTVCIQGINNPSVKPGIFLQLSKKYPNLTIKATSETIEGYRPAGRLSFTLRNGQFIE
ncbi:hypothetical protein [Laceyella putida]|uniref:Uncharacterized protein n=1 Tax=Laceyella putida TaxID=110101 RepID=A0ABW2RHL0_9BACL